MSAFTSKLLLIAIISIQMCCAFIETKNLALITWQHAVNNKSRLEEALTSQIQMLEADIQVGNLTDGSATNIPIMAHPPAKISDLSFEYFLRNISEYNSRNTHQKKGIKLDFKTIEAFNASIPILRANINSTIDQFPVWLNADIIRGPGAANSIPVDAHQFLSESKRLMPNVTLSVGWTTSYDKTTANATYTRDDVTRMLDTLSANGVNETAVSFPVRACYAADSIPELSELIGNYSGATLTVWSAENDPVNVGNLRKLIFHIGVEKTYVDVPKKLMDELNLNSATSSRFSVFSVVSAVVLLIFNVF